MLALVSSACFMTPAALFSTAGARSLLRKNVMKLERSSLGGGLSPWGEWRPNAALIAFGAASLLYMVTEELLVEAHASLGEGGTPWYVDVMFFVGFLGSLLLEKIVDA